MGFSVKAWHNKPDTSTPISGAALTDLESRLAAYVDLAVPVGTVKAYVGSTEPTAGAVVWKLLNGQALSRATYSALFAMIGTTYGTGDGSSTFNLPNILGRAIIAAGAGAGLTSRALGASGGEENHAMTLAELAAHTHTGTTVATDPVPTGFGVPSTAGGAVWSTGGSGSNVVPRNDGTPDWGVRSLSHTHTFTTASNGSGTGHNNMQPWAALNFLIRAA